MAKAIGITVSARTQLVNVVGLFAGEALTLTCTYDTTTATSGKSFQLVIQDRPGGTTLVTATGTVTDAVNGVFTFALTTTDTGTTLGPGAFSYYVQETVGGVTLATGVWPVMAP